METVAIRKQLENEVNKFYLDTLEFLRVNELEGDSDDFVYFYSHIRDLVNPHTHFTTLDKLGPIVFYIFLKTRGTLLVLPRFLEYFNLKYNEFTANLKKALKYYPDYTIRDKKTIIKKFITTILNSFKAKQQAIVSALTIFTHFYPLIQHKKEEIVAAVICTLTSISLDLHGVTIKLISDRAGICQSTIYASISSKIFPYLNIPKSFGLRPSFELMKRKIGEKASQLKINFFLEEEIEMLWRSGSSLDKIAKSVNFPRDKVIVILEQSLGDYRNYRVRYRITQQEILTTCRLRIEKLSYREIALKVHRSSQVTKMIVENNLENYLEELKAKELTAMNLRCVRFNNRVKRKEYLSAYRREKYAEQKKERKLRLDDLTNGKSINRVVQGKKSCKISPDKKEIEKRFRAMKPKLYPALLRTLDELKVSYEVSKEIVHSHNIGNTAYTACNFSVEGVAYKVIDSSNCIWITSKGVKGSHVYNLVRNMFDKK